MGLIYLDNGATSFPKPEEVYQFMDYFYRHYGVNPGRSGYDLCLEAGEMVEETRKLLNDFFGGDEPNRVCFGYNSTDALNLAIFGLLQPGDQAITTTLEHNSVLRPLYHLSLTGVEVDYVPFDGRGFVDPDDIKKKIKKNTKLVVVNHASNVIGTIQPVNEIGRICKERGITFLIDASQSAGKIPINMNDMNIDVVAFTGHKSLLGPTGIGGLCVGPEANIRITRAGGTGVRSAQRTHLEEYPWRLEYGTINLLGLAGLNAGVKWVLARGLEAIHEQEMRLTRMLVEGLKEIEGVTLYCQDQLDRHIGVISFNVRGLEAQDTGIMLDVDYNIACRTGLHCAPLVHEQLGTDKIKGAVRFGVGPFNTEEEIKTAIQAVKEIAAFKR
ncbi:MAG: aminotransferase class V-fold PLP-dependent enzyme [Candidatus Saccharicenans sp.]|jgi:cysteine desulfurase family protein|nr:aminotransferase class V-fold PLP-dependent enzyme [Candidatus Saccharicenans sp.]HOE14989.1 aminotransferase class V-fold PLP-dependent enzyme [Candidatus Saccharicenans sp.]HOJ26625.1 aminotransferase class V-fold PLP-dependent enzyme [Candidatus Saccharicenans sp.]HOL46027.1 aminotransferase class V-fold PLP-dependent enzyme [Candidatus Saccharicenans sp.]HOM93702.1 aminotransferase class V-fold PLP-dependent enzyme [Candidatus Saccharicenans sp.]